INRAHYSNFGQIDATALADRLALAGQNRA
ncbi:MAG: hypothetical protein RIS09_72, partial [Actinomycetota bacterium]